MFMVRVFYGWWVVIATIITVFVAAGTGIASFSLFIKPFGEEFGWGRGPVSLAISIGLLVGGIIGPVIGYFIDRYGSKRVMVGGSFLMGISFLALSQIPPILILFYFAYIFLGMGWASTALIPNDVLISNWFDKNRGKAMGMSMIGRGFGLFLIPPLTAFLIGTFGWRYAYILLSLFVWLLAIPTILIIVREKPEDIGLSPNGILNHTESSLTPDSTISKEVTGFTLSEASRTLPFWLIGLGYLLIFLSTISLMNHMIPFFTDIGYSQPFAAWAYGLFGAITIGGRLGIGFLADRIPKKYAAALSYSLIFIGIGILMAVEEFRFFLLPFLLVFGLGFGGTAVCLPLITVECFGKKALGRLIGIILFGGVGAFIGPWLMGYIFDLTGSYQLAFILIATSSIIATGIISKVKPPLLRAAT